jgi:tetratricopeptide (TPR) repeat protein
MSGGNSRRRSLDLARAMAIGGGLTLSCHIAHAQFVTDAPTQAEMLKLSAAQQSAQLADIVRRTPPNRRCAQARVSLEKTFNDGEGAWLVECEEGQDYFVRMPAQPKKAAIALPCILARTTADIDCYANLRTVLPGHADQCTKSPHPDRVISACTAIIQSGRLANDPVGLAIAYQSRANAFLGYQQFDLALADLDRAVTLTPTDAYALYNRAVALERKGDFGQAARDLDEVIRLKPDHPLARFERGYVLLRHGEHDRAIADLDQFIGANPSDAKAYRTRAAAYEAKGDAAKADADMKKARELDPNVQRLVLAPPSPPPAPAPGGLTGNDRQAAYCMEASFGYTGQYTRLIAVLRENIKSVEAMRERADLPPNGKDQIAAVLKSINERIADGEAKKTRWNELTMLYLNYLKTHKLLESGKTQLVAAISNEVRKDQEAVSDAYRACLRLCKPDDTACRSACDGKANASEPSKRMLRCEQLAADFK